MIVSAPGKLVLAGEYAVLLPGASCIVAAVERRLWVRSVSSFEWTLSNGSEAWAEGAPVPEGLRFAVEALRSARACFGGPSLALSTSDELCVGGLKLGLGGSAAATVAVTAAAGQGQGVARDSVWAIADEVHRRVQGGRGSGADVAASVHGGVLRYTREPRRAGPIAVHPDVRLLAVWTGASEKTAPRLERFQAFVAAKPDLARAFVERSEAGVSQLEAALVSGDADSIRKALSLARGALESLQHEAGIELVTPKLALAAELAARHGAGGKLSGAGGGDCAVVLTVGDASVRQLCEAYADAGLEAIPLAFAAEGVRVEPA